MKTIPIGDMTEKSNTVHKEERKELKKEEKIAKKGLLENKNSDSDIQLFVTYECTDTHKRKKRQNHIQERKKKTTEKKNKRRLISSISYHVSQLLMLTTISVLSSRILQTILNFDI